MDKQQVKWVYITDKGVQPVKWYRDTAQAGLSLWELVNEPETYVPKHDVLAFGTQERAEEFKARMEMGPNLTDLSD